MLRSVVEASGQALAASFAGRPGFQRRDGRVVPIAPANIAHRAVLVRAGRHLVRAGRHRVTFGFDSPTSKPGFTLTRRGFAAALIGLLPAPQAGRIGPWAAHIASSAARAR